MKILILPSWYPASPDDLSGVFFREQAEALGRCGNDVRVVAIQQQYFSRILRKNHIKIGRFTTQRNGILESQCFTFAIPLFLFGGNENLYFQGNGWIATRLGLAIAKHYLKEGWKPDLVHVHSYKAARIAIAIKERYGIPFVITEHSSKFLDDTLFRAEDKLFRLACSASAVNIAVSGCLERTLRSRFRQEIKYLPNMVNTEYFRPDNKENKVFDFICVGALNQNKNHSALIEAFFLAFKTNSTARLVIVGDGAEYGNLANQISRLGLQRNITLYGSASREQVLRLFQKSKSFVLVSKHETFGVVLIEAMSCGLPVLSTKSGGPESIIADEELGFLCDMGIEAIANGLHRMKQFIPDRDYIREFAIREFSEEAVVARLMVLYRQARSIFNA